MTQENTKQIPDALVRISEWHAASRRLLPWRQDPTPYHTWIAEIMLQQTRIEAVIPYYGRFLDELPDIPALAAVPEDRGAIASIAFGLPEPAVDGNVMRVMARLLARPDDILKPRVRQEFTGLLRAFYPSGRNAGLLTEGIMELGETVCLPNTAPRCESCPLNGICLAHLVHNELSYPVRSAPASRRIEQKTVFLLRCGDRYAIRKRKGHGLLAGLWEFPNVEGSLSEAEAVRQISAWGLQAEDTTPCGTAKHIFTHVEWRMTGYLIRCPEQVPLFLWCLPDEIEDCYSLPTAFRFYRKLL